MANRARPTVVSTRATPSEKVLIRAAAELDGVSVAEFIHRAVTSDARQRVGHLVGISERTRAPQAA